MELQKVRPMWPKLIDKVEGNQDELLLGPMNYLFWTLKMWTKQTSNDSSIGFKPLRCYSKSFVLGQIASVASNARAFIVLCGLGIDRNIRKK